MKNFYYNGLEYFCLPYRDFIANNLNLNMYVYCCDPYIYSHNGKNSIRESFAQIKAIVDCKLWHTSAISLEQSPFI